VSPGRLLTLVIEKPAAGGRMLARHEGQVVLVAGAIPGERVTARVEREQHGTLFATTVAVDTPHPARRDAGPDPACGGMAYAHIAPDHQRALKAQVVADAFGRIARMALSDAVPVAASPERGYRMRARVHVRQGRIGSFREGTHEICDYGRTGQLLESSNTLLHEVATRLQRRRVDEIDAIEIAENLAGDERVLHVEPGPRRIERAVLADLASAPGVTGLSAALGPGTRFVTVAGRAWVADALAAFGPTPGASLGDATLRRHATSFFQANRYLTPSLAARVLGFVRPGLLVDLYAGVGLFALTAASAGQAHVVAVEGDRGSAADLAHNARPFGDRVQIERGAVEHFLGRHQAEPVETMIVDPPRTGMTREAMTGVLDARAPRVIYVSCDVATLARDAGRLTAAGYRLSAIEAFDLFPNTPHIESLAVFDR
jgi:tRNA/tmRNA/rRNA uracil-C5-methylase (TrmA/RlmC/RlmD family)